MRPALEVNADTLVGLCSEVHKAKEQGKHILKHRGKYVLTDYAAYVVHYYYHHALREHVH